MNPIGTATVKAKRAVPENIVNGYGANSRSRTVMLKIGSEFAKRLEAVFERDLKDTKEVDLEKWRQRPLSEKIKETASSLLSYWL